MRSRAIIKNRSYSTGWWGVPGDGTVKGFTKVHVCGENGQPACGARLRDTMIYQWCAAGVWSEFLECEHCKSMWRAGKFSEEE